MCARGRASLTGRLWWPSSASRGGRRCEKGGILGWNRGWSTLHEPAEFVLSADILFQLAVPLALLHIGGRTVAHLVWVERLVALNVANLLHPFDLLTSPCIECDRFDFRDVRTHFAVHASTLNTYEDAEVPRGPPGGASFAISADIVARLPD